MGMTRYETTIHCEFTTHLTYIYIYTDTIYYYYIIIVIYCYYYPTHRRSGMKSPEKLPGPVALLPPGTHTHPHARARTHARTHARTPRRRRQQAGIQETGGSLPVYSGLSADRFRLSGEPSSAMSRPRYRCPDRVIGNRRQRQARARATRHARARTHTHADARARTSAQTQACTRARAHTQTASYPSGDAALYRW